MALLTKMIVPKKYVIAFLEKLEIYALDCKDIVEKSMDVRLFKLQAAFELPLRYLL